MSNTIKRTSTQFEVKPYANAYPVTAKDRYGDVENIWATDDSIETILDKHCYELVVWKSDYNGFDYDVEIYDDYRE